MNIPASLTKCQRIWFCSSVFVAFLVGCSRAPQLTSSSPPTPSSLAAQNRSKESEGYQSLSKSIEKLDAKTLRAYVDALTNPNNPGQAGPKSRWITVTASDMVNNHPAWILADQLESGGVFPLPARDLKISPRSAQGTGSIATFDAESKAVESAITGRKINGSSTPEGLEKAQLGALDSFNRAWRERQLEIRRSEERLRERELEDGIREQRRVQIRTIALQSVPTDVALELSNLRLQLLRNLAIAPTQREAARQRIAQIEADLQEIWKEQMALQEKLVNESLEASPSKLRREGMERIRATMRDLAAKDALERSRVISEFEALVGRDFNRAKSVSLSLFLPPAIVPEEIRASFFEQSNISESSGKSVSAKTQDSITQQQPTQKLAEVGPIAISEIRRLRQIALRDATVWAQAANQLKSPVESKIQREPE